MGISQRDSVMAPLGKKTDQEYIWNSRGIKSTVKGITVTWKKGIKQNPLGIIFVFNKGSGEKKKTRKKWHHI